MKLARRLPAFVLRRAALLSGGCGHKAANSVQIAPAGKPALKPSCRRKPSRRRPSRPGSQDGRDQDDHSGRGEEARGQGIPGHGLADDAVISIEDALTVYEEAKTGPRTGGFRSGDEFPGRSLRHASPASDHGRLAPHSGKGQPSAPDRPAHPGNQRRPPQPGGEQPQVDSPDGKRMGRAGNQVLPAAPSGRPSRRATGGPDSTRIGSSRSSGRRAFRKTWSGSDRRKLFKPLALSSARALGLWQFIRTTGLNYDLNQDKYVDERRDPYKSTIAAIKYLDHLHSFFGDWTTALASYNCGEGYVQRMINSQNISYLDNFWDLFQRLPFQTARYVPRFIAVVLIIRDPAKYGMIAARALPAAQIRYRQDHPPGQAELLGRHPGARTRRSLNSSIPSSARNRRPKTPTISASPSDTGRRWPALAHAAEIRPARVRHPPREKRGNAVVDRPEVRNVRPDDPAPQQSPGNADLSGAIVEDPGPGLAIRAIRNFALLNAPPSRP